MSTVLPISRKDIPAIAAFLHANLNDRISPSGWASSLEPPWRVEAPNYGFMLVHNGIVVGVYLAFYSERHHADEAVRICNLAGWCVRPEHRLSSLRLLRALTAQEGYHFTDLSPSGNVVPINRKLGFQLLDTTTAIFPNLPWLTLPGTSRVTSRRHVIEETLQGEDRRRFQDHRDASAAVHILLTHGAESCHVILRRDRRKRLPFFASVLYVSNPAVFHRMVKRLARHLLLRHGMLATLAELRIVERRPKSTIALTAGRPKMFWSPTLTPDDIDYLYSELTCVAW